MDLNRVLGALLQGAAQPPRRRTTRRSTSSGGTLGALLGGGSSRSAEARAARAIGALAAGALAGWMRGSQQAPEPPPARAPSRPAPRDVAPPPRDVSAPARRIPDTGASPWSAKPPPAPPEPEGPDAEEAEALLMVRAMIAAAKSDGAVDAAERAAIAGQLDAAGLSPEERDFVLNDFDRPLTPEALAKEARDPMLRARLYAAAFAACGDVTPAERAWLDALAKAMRLDKAAAAAIEERLSA
ncbi:hypothetical protein DFH01_22320 [Falsiroseomonas bella]|uniref:DUF533 domain-containing protein n=1 Tax=Falsiroseomonas bella TaxID=2184016 RepID=A0A317F7D8_9PROT|nr:DUF533 domain-containing protein [Falsiroseomonas bella]PWS35060.1 hypothetical protein DFH01_22320 [Falsiroseomonas bella]